MGICSRNSQLGLCFQCTNLAPEQPYYAHIFLLLISCAAFVFSGNLIMKRKHIPGTTKGGRHEYSILFVIVAISFAVISIQQGMLPFSPEQCWLKGISGSVLLFTLLWLALVGILDSFDFRDYLFLKKWRLIGLACFCFVFSLIFLIIVISTNTNTNTEWIGEFFGVLCVTLSLIFVLSQFALLVRQWKQNTSIPFSHLSLVLILTTTLTIGWIVLYSVRIESILFNEIEIALLCFLSGFYLYHKYFPYVNDIGYLERVVPLCPSAYSIDSQEQEQEQEQEQGLEQEREREQSNEEKRKSNELGVRSVIESELFYAE